MKEKRVEGIFLCRENEGEIGCLEIVSFKYRGKITI